MIAYIQGKLTYKSPTCVYVEAHGVAYEINISLHTYEAIETLQEAKLYTYLKIAEDAHQLYGFATIAEKDLFLHLISVNGVGAGTARLVLSSLNTAEIEKAIVSGNVSLIQSIKGIGPKTAQRVILELKDKVGKGLEKTMQLPNISSSLSFSSEALAALAVLGFPKLTAEKAMAKAVKDNPDMQSVEELIKMSLKNL